MIGLISSNILCPAGNRYRYGFNGKELDPEGMGGGGSTYDYGFRIYNAQLGKFLSVDPLTRAYPQYTPYQYAGNKPIKYIDLDGLEEAEKKVDVDKPLILKVTEGKLTYVVTLSGKTSNGGYTIFDVEVIKQNKKKKGVKSSVTVYSGGRGRGKSSLINGKRIDPFYGNTYELKPGGMDGFNYVMEDFLGDRLQVKGKDVTVGDVFNKVMAGNNATVTFIGNHKDVPEGGTHATKRGYEIAKYDDDAPSTGGTLNEFMQTRADVVAAAIITDSTIDVQSIAASSAQNLYRDDFETAEPGNNRAGISMVVREGGSDKVRNK